LEDEFALIQILGTHTQFRSEPHERKAMLRQLAFSDRNPYSCGAMWRIASVGLVAVLTATVSGQSKPDWQGQHEACIAALSSFAVDPIGTKPPELPTDLAGVTIEYVSSGCYGNCPAFTLKLEMGKAAWEGHAFVKKKGKAGKQISDRQFVELVHAWLDSKMYAMRDDYCQPVCPDGTSTIITDVQDTSITLRAPSYSKKILECFTTINGKPQTPKPPAQYFQLSRQLVQLAKSNHWL
jgi:hypothetical protein